MATSIHKAYLRSKRRWGSNTPVDALFARDVVINNACHAADSMGQARVNFTRAHPQMLDTPAIDIGARNIRWNEWTYLGSLGQWPIPLHEDGRSYRYRIRLAAHTFDNNPSYTTTFRVVLSPINLAEGYLRAEEDFVYEATTNSATAMWLSGTSRGPNAWSNMLEIPKEEARAWAKPTATLNTIGGTSAAVRQTVVCANLFGKVDAFDADPDWILSIAGLYLCEFVAA